jgi:hypothetical protein
LASSVAGLPPARTAPALLPMQASESLALTEAGPPLLLMSGSPQMPTKKL